jgi:hypothetical protein
MVLDYNGDLWVMLAPGVWKSEAYVEAETWGTLLAGFGPVQPLVPGDWIPE